jgi:hypothetical protein
MSAVDRALRSRVRGFSCSVIGRSSGRDDMDLQRYVMGRVDAKWSPDAALR